MRCAQCGTPIEGKGPFCSKCNSWKDARIVIGEYELSYYRGDPQQVWIGKSDGEGMSCDAALLEAAIAAFWKERF